ncbi:MULTISPECIES: GDSL-type esterase/lipase family protein [unclassified Agrococcus]|uniref:SGNH/GDSL hydrolase family protein n=1 Tax=unclassified Agrococcus TaxID=2615065 RepID=UPI00361A02E0
MAASDLPEGVTKLGEFKGAKGDKGDTGLTGTFASASATTLAAGAQATVAISGPETAKVVEFGIPRGNTGSTGSTGPAGTITGATASALAAGAAPTVTLGGTASARTIAFGIPAGAKGDPGVKGDTGPQGPAAPTATTTVQGLVELATQAETNAGAAGVVPTAANVKAAFDAWEALLRPVRNVAVFVGASNVTPWTWPEYLAQAEGWTAKNYAIAGQNLVSGQFEAQLDTAIADASFDNATVGYVWIAGGGNDARANYSYAQVLAAMDTLAAKARAQFPNARVIVVPGLWNNLGRHPNLMPVSTAMRDSALTNRCEVIWHAWEWLIGLDSTYMADATHPSAKGYQEFLKYMRAFLRGGNTARNIGPLATPLLASGWTVHDRGWVNLECVDGMVHMGMRLQRGTTAAPTNIAAQTPVINLPKWASLNEVAFPRTLMGFIGGALTPVGCYVGGTVGELLNLFTIPSGAPAASEFHLPPVQWPIGS